MGEGGFSHSRVNYSVNCRNMFFFIHASRTYPVRSDLPSFESAVRPVRRFIKRLRRAAASIPQERIEKAIGDMARRTERLYQVKGGLFEEGGRKSAA